MRAYAILVLGFLLPSTAGSQVSDVETVTEILKAVASMRAQPHETRRICLPLEPDRIKQSYSSGGNVRRYATMASRSEGLSLA